MKQVIKAFAIVLVALLYAELSAGDFEKRAPFSDIKWTANGTVPIVKVGEKSYELQEINGISVKKILQFCKRNYGVKAYRRFNEDLPEVFHNMGLKLEDKVELMLKEQDSGRVVIKRGVSMTEENRRLILQKRKSSNKT